MVMTCTYGSNDQDDLNQGLTLYQVMHKAMGKAAAAESDATDLDQMSEGVMTPSLQELRLLQKNKVDQPTQIYHMTHSLGSLSVLMDITHGANHRLSVQLRVELYGRWKQLEDGLLQYCYSEHPNQNVPWLPKVFRYIQLQLCIFHTACALPQLEPVPLPDFGPLYQILHHRHFVLLPDIPARYRLPPAPAPRPALPPAARLPPATPTPTPAPASSPPPQRNLVLNPAVNAEWRTKFDESGKTIKDLRNDPRLPPRLDGQRLCLSWHLRGQCFDNCGTTRDHSGQPLDGHTPLVGDDLRRLDDFVKVAVVRA
jgi:hypothetical protein